MLNKHSRYFLFVTSRFAGFFQLMNTNTTYLNIVITDYIKIFFYKRIQHLFTFNF